MKLNKAVKFILSIAICELIGVFGSVFTTPSIATWYSLLNKASFNPPNWIFGPVWTALFFLMGISLFLIWDKGIKTAKSKIAAVFFFIQLIFNLIWSIIFFGLHSPFYALIDIILLWIFILLTIIKFYKISKNAAYLLIPYLLWVSFAAALNLSIWLMN